MSEEFRPTTWDDYIGQTALKERVNTHIESALIRDEPLDHMLLVGVPGCGKTTLAQIIANQYGYDYERFIMPINEKVMVKMIRMLSSMVWLFDEIHRMTPKQQETLLPVIEDGYFQTNSGDRLYLHDVTIVAATTEPEKIIPPLWDRFKIKPPFDEYTDEEMAQIVTQKARIAGLDVDDDMALALGRASGGVPRNAESLIVMARDLTVTGTEPDVADVLTASRVTEDGLTEDHLRYIKCLASVGGQAGLAILVAHLRMPQTVIVELERLLVKRGFLNYTKQGRELMGDGWRLAKE